MPWTPCDCADCTDAGEGSHAHAYISMRDAHTNDHFKVRVPHTSRYDTTGWHGRARVRWEKDGETMHGLERVRGSAGITAVDGTGATHRVRHGSYVTHEPHEDDWATIPDDALHDAVLHKAKLKTGQRWITVHPNGKDEKGVPILIQEGGDGSWKVVGGAGGKLNHLKLTNVKSPEEHAAKAKEKAKEKRESEKTRKEEQTPEAAEVEKKSKEDVEAEKLLAEREFVRKIRDKLGGVDDDLGDEQMEGLEAMSSGAQNLIKTRKHKAQLRQAMERVEEASGRLVKEKVIAATERAAIEGVIDEDPVLAAQARAMASEELHLKELEQSEMAAERREGKTRQTSGQTDVGKRAAEQIAEAIEQAPDPSEELDSLGGVDGETPLPAPDEVRRRALKALSEAKQAAEDGNEREAARKMRRFEIQNARASEMREKALEDPNGVERSLMYADMLGEIASSASTAKKLGLTDTERVPIQEAEVAEIMDVLKDSADLRKLRGQFRKMNKAAERGKYAAARQAYDLSTETTSEEVELSIKEEVQRALTEQLIGMGSRTRAEYLQAVTAGHYAAIADVSLGIAGQRYLDRPTVDALGMKNAAVLTRYAMEADGHDKGAILEALETHHVAELDRKSTEAIAKAEAVIPGITETVEDVGDIENAMGALDAFEGDIADAQEAVGAAIGVLEGTATLGQAFREKVPDRLTVPIGTSGMDTTLQWLHSIGLKPGDYGISKKEGEVYIPKKAWDKLISRDSQETMEHRAAVTSIKNGEHDEEGWLPAGIESRPDSYFNGPESPPRAFSEPMRFDGDVHANLENHIGGRIAEGEQPHDILSDLLTPRYVDSASDRDAYIDSVKQLFPMTDESGKAVKYEEHADHFNGLAEKALGGEQGAFHAQDINVADKRTHEAAFQALAKVPGAKHAFTPSGELDHTARRDLRAHFHERMGIDPKVNADEVRYQREQIELGGEPDKNAGTMSLFGDSGPSPEWKEWAQKRDRLLSKYPRAGLNDALAALGPEPTDAVGAKAWGERAEALRSAARSAPTAWQKYVADHGSSELAYGALQDELKGQFLEHFHPAHGRLHETGLHMGVQQVRNAERHIEATATVDEKDRLKKEANRIHAQLRDRVGGRFAGEGKGAVKAKYTRHLEEATIAERNQGALFSSAEVAAVAGDRKLTPGPGERRSIGARAEQQLASLIGGGLGRQFNAGEKVGLFSGVNMDGDRVHQQRVVKIMETGRRLGAYLGTGAGKSLASIGSFTNAHAKGDTKRALFLTPLAVEQQFGGEMLRFTKPGEYQWDTGGGKSHTERVGMLANAANHMSVMTHESFAQTAMQVMADHHGKTPDQMVADMRAASPADRAALMREAMDANGIPPMFVYYDEGHKATTREGPASMQHLITSAVTHPTNATHMLMGTATPHKNDESEMHSMAGMIDPEKYGDRHEFMQSFGTGSQHNPEALRREMDHVTYSARIPPEGVERNDTENPRIVDGKKVAGDGPIKLTGEHRAGVDKMKAAYKAAKDARDAGGVDIEAVKTLSPGRFAGRPASEHEQLARELGPNLGIARESAMRRAVNQAPPEHNQKLRQMADVLEHDMNTASWADRDGTEYKGKPSIVFTDRAVEARMIHAELEKRGLRSVMYHGAMDTSAREGVRRGFQPEGGGEATHDIIVATAAAEAGLNLQRAKAVHHYDVPQTEKSHNQRSGRAYRQGQKGDVDVHDWHTDADFERSGRRRLRRKAALASVFQTEFSSMDETGISSAYQAALAKKHQGREV